MMHNIKVLVSCPSENNDCPVPMWIGLQDTGGGRYIEIQAEAADDKDGEAGRSYAAFDGVDEIVGIVAALEEAAKKIEKIIEVKS